MRPVSARFLRTLHGSHSMVADARIVPAGTIGVNPPGIPVPILSGDVQLNATAEVRSTLDLTIDGNGWWPSGSLSPLAPYGNELFVRRGIRYGDGTTEWVSLGYHRIYTVDQEAPPNGPIRVTARDRMSGLIDARLLAPVQVPATASRSAVVAQFVHEVYPGAVIEWTDPAGSEPVGRALTAEEERHAFLADLVISTGAVWWWDHRGHLVIGPPPEPSSPVWRVAGGEGGVLVSLSKELTREGVHNAVVATGEAADTAEPARAVAVDDDAASPTYWHGPFGKVPQFYSSPFITTNAQAASAAASLLRQQRGLPYSVDFSAIPNPALEPHDPIEVGLPGRLETHVIESMAIPLTADGVLSGAAREQTYVAIEG